MSDPDDKEFERDEEEYHAKAVELTDKLINVVDDAMCGDDDYDGGQALLAAMMLAVSTLLMFGDAEDVETFCDFVRRESHEVIEKRDNGEFDEDEDDTGVRH